MPHILRLLWNQHYLPAKQHRWMGKITHYKSRKVFLPRFMNASIPDICITLHTATFKIKLVLLSLKFKRMQGFVLLCTYPVPFLSIDRLISFMSCHRGLYKQLWSKRIAIQRYRLEHSKRTRLQRTMTCGSTELFALTSKCTPQILPTHPHAALWTCYSTMAGEESASNILKADADQ